MSNQHIHQGQPVLAYGAVLDEAQIAVILLHGRGSTAQNILSLAGEFPQEKITYLAPQAANQTWYPNSGFIPIEANEPYVSSAFQVITDILAHITESGISTEQIMLGGFSQGACLASEFVARHPQRYGGLFVLSGAVMGPPDMPRTYSGSFDGTPVFIGSIDRDPWVTEQQLHLTAEIFRQLDAIVVIEIQPGTEHTIRQSEIAHVNNMIAELAYAG
jgi:predicted esterase